MISAIVDWHFLQSFLLKVVGLFSWIQLWCLVRQVLVNLPIICSRYELKKHKQIVLTDVFFSILFFVLAENVKAELEQVWKLVLSFWRVSLAGRLFLCQIHNWRYQQLVKHFYILMEIVASAYVVVQNL